MEVKTSLTRDDIVWILRLLCWSTLVIISYFKQTFLWIIPPFIGILIAEVYFHLRIKKERKLTLIEELKKLRDEFEKFTYGSYTISLPAIVGGLFNDKSFIDATKSNKKLVKVWSYHLQDHAHILSEKTSATKELLNSPNPVKHLTDILRAFTDMISAHFKLHRKFKEMVNDLDTLPQTYLERYNKGVREYNELFRILKKIVMDYDEVGPWLKEKYFFDFIEELKLQQPLLPPEGE